MYQSYGVKGPYFEDAGALHFTWGKFLMPISAVEHKREVVERTRNIVIVVAVVAIIALLVVSTVLAGHQPNSMPYNYALESSIGQPIEVVANKMGVSLSDFERLGPVTYSLRNGCRLSGIPFSVTLYFGEDACLSGFEYLAEYDAEINQASFDLYKLILDLRLDKSATEGLEGIELTVGGIKKYLQNNKLSVERVGDCSPTYYGDPVFQYLRQVERTEGWPGLVGEYVVKPAKLYSDLSMQYAPEKETIYVRIDYIIEPEHNR